MSARNVRLQRLTWITPGSSITLISGSSGARIRMCKPHCASWQNLSHQVLPTSGRAERSRVLLVINFRPRYFAKSDGRQERRVRKMIGPKIIVLGEARISRSTFPVLQQELKTHAYFHAHSSPRYFSRALQNAL